MKTLRYLTVLAVWAFWLLRSALSFNTHWQSACGP